MYHATTTMSEPTQQAYLKAAKRALGLTWDEFAAQAGIHPRAFKTYRMPEHSQDHRPLPALARRSIDQLLAQHQQLMSKASNGA
ncbi:MAG: hypothetical protein KDH17_22615 [Rhodocyclaceae bacterium]|nr:hypothetical protein [Rhodocyclaceae bacterium]